MDLEKNLSAYKKVPYFDDIENLYANRHTLDFPYHTHDTFNISLVLNQSFNAKLPSKLLNARIGRFASIKDKLNVDGSRN